MQELVGVRASLARRLKVAEEHLAQARTQLSLKLRLVTQRATDREVGVFRTALDGRLADARRSSALCQIDRHPPL